MTLSVPKPMLASLVSDIPVGTDWTYEVKWDGYRTMAVKQDTRVTLYSRNLKDATRQYSSITRAVASIPATSAIFDTDLLRVRPGSPQWP